MNVISNLGLKMKNAYLVVIFISIAISGCGSKFENEYTESCVKEGKWSKERCTCISGVLDNIMTKEQIL